MNSDCLLAFPIPCFSKKMHTDGEKGLEGRIVVFEGVKWLVYLRSNRGSGNRKLFPGYRKLLELSRQVREGMRSTNSFIFEKSTSNYYRDLSKSIRVILTKPFYYCHSTRVVESPADSFKKKKKKIIPSFQDSSIESMRGITRCNYTPAKGFNACSIRRNARVQLQPYSPDARPNINSARNK